jgi:hypothetical protein
VSASVRIKRHERRQAAILAGSLLLHAAVLAWLALPVRPLLENLIADDVSTMTVDLRRPERQQQPAPRPAAASQTVAPSPALPFQVRQPARPAPAGVPVLNVPAAGAARPGTATRPAPLPGEGAGDLRTALRSSPTGCISADAVGLNRREREKCDEHFGAAKARGDYAGPMDAGKANAFETQAINQDLKRKYRESSMGPGVDHRSREGPGTMKEIPFVLGAEQDGLGNARNAQQQRLKQLRDYEKAEARAKQRARENP